ncbi:MAG: PDZ domain-containing protein [Verrucomicrobiota bacterium]
MSKSFSFPGWRGVFLVAAAVLLLPSAMAKEKEIPAVMRAQMDAAIARVKPALVRIRVVSTEFSEGREIKQQAVGSGAIISKDGYIITNHHVAGHAARMFCTLWNREEVEAELIGTDPLTDISVIKLIPEKSRTFDFVGFGDSSLVRVGDAVLAMGSPMALSQSVTLGILSNTEMVIPRFWGGSSAFKLDGENVGGLVRWLAHDAAIYGGNSGGPLVNLKGEIIGINEISYGLSGAIPGNLAQDVARQIIARGRVQRSWLGVDVQPLFKHSDEEHGILISGVIADSPASAAGLQAGDILLRLNGTATDVRYDEQLPGFMALTTGLAIGKEVPGVIRRNGKEIKVTFKPAEREEVFPKQKEFKQWGFTGRNVSSIIAREMKRPSTDGVMIATVRPGGPVGDAKPALEPRDVLVEVNGEPIKSAEALADFTRKLTDGKTEPVPVIATFERKAARFLAVVKVGLQELKDPGLEVTKAWLPVETQVISRDIARQLGDSSLKGFYLTRVFADSTAAKAGLKPGDFITAVDDEKLTATGPEFEDELSSLIRQYDVGKTVELSVLRGKSRMKVSVELARSPHLRREMKKYRNNDFEFTVRDVSFFDAADEQLKDDQGGALVEEIKSGSWAELGGLYVGDFILEVNGHGTARVDDLRRVMEKIAADKKNVVTIKVMRGIHTLFLELEPNWKN